MAKQITITCPICTRKLETACYEDPSVGIPFDFDVADGSECRCIEDEDFEGIQLIYLQIENAYHRSFLFNKI